MMFHTVSLEDSGVSPHPFELPTGSTDSLGLFHSSEQLTAGFPSFVVIVRARPSLGPWNGEILLGGPILQLKMGGIRGIERIT